MDKERSNKKTIFLISMFLLILLMFSTQAFAASRKTTVRISLNKTKASVTAGSSITLKASVSGTSGKVSWSSSNSKIARVKNGKVTGIKAGTAKITAKVKGKKAVCTVTVKNKKSASKRQHNMYAPYIRKLSRNYKEMMKKYGYDPAQSEIYFVFVDINKDGIDECICRALYNRNTSVTTCDYMNPYSEKTFIYTIYKNKVKTVLKQDLYPGAHSENIQIYKNRNYVERWWSTTHSFYTMKNGVLNKKASGECTSPSFGGTWTVNGKRVSRSKYNSYMNKMTNNYTGYTMYKFTENNLKRFL